MDMKWYHFVVLISIWCLLNWESLKWFGLFAHPLWSRGCSNCFVLWFIRLSIIRWFVEVKCKIEQPLLWTYHLRVAQMVKNLSAMEETQVWSLGQEDPLENGMAAHLRIFAWRIPRTEEHGGLYSPWVCRVRHNGEIITFTLNLHCNILQF